MGVILGAVGGWQTSSLRPRGGAFGLAVLELERMKREDFVKVVEEALDSLPKEFRSRIRNVAILVDDFPLNQPPARPGQPKRLLLGIFHGVPTTKKSVFDLSMGPDHIVLYQKNIEAVCSCTNWGHYFGMTEDS